MMKKGANVFGLIVILLIIGSAFVGVVTAEEIIIDTEKGESRFTTDPPRELPYEWWYAQDHLDSSSDGWFDTKAYPPGQGNGNFWYTFSFPEVAEYKGIWETSLPPSGNYEVFVWIPSPDLFDPNLDKYVPPNVYLPTQVAKYKIFHKTKVDIVTIDQDLNKGRFTSLGVFDFGTTAKVELTNNQDEFWRSVAFDAVKFVPVAALNNPPYTPSNPFPVNHAIGQSIYTDLSWTGGDPDAGDTVTYDVYFGTSTSPPEVSTAQSGTSYDPGTLSCSTYYWKIKATDNHGAPTTGPLWNFTTGSALTCAIELRKNGAEIDGIDVGKFFDIYVGDSTDDTGIKDVRFSSDDSQDGIPTGEWTVWYEWSTSSGDWNAISKTKAWLFTAEGGKEVWAEIKDGNGQTRNCFANIVTGNLYWLAKAIMSEASVGRQEERIAVGWTVLNRLDSNDFPSTIKQVVESGYAHNQEPTQKIIDLSKDILERKYADPTGGATHFFSPRSMGSGYGPYKIPGTDKSAYIPDWTIPKGYSKESPPPGDWEMTEFYQTIDNTEWVSDVENVRNWYFMFYRSINQPPVAIFTYSPENPLSGQTIIFKASDSYDPDPDGEIFSYKWNFGDGTIIEGLAESGLEEHRFRGAMGEPKEYTVKLTVKDNKGATASYTDSITVYPLKRYIIFYSSLSQFLPPPAHKIMEVTVYYNWVEETEGQDEYIVSEVHLDSELSLSFALYMFYINDDTQKIWSKLHKGVGKEDVSFTYPFNVPRDHAKTIGNEYFEGLAVGSNSNLNFVVDGLELGLNLRPTFFRASRTIELGPGKQTEVPSIYPEGEMAGILAALSSPAELHIYDSQGNVTGLVNGKIKEEILNSIYDEESKTGVIFSPEDINSYSYEIVGTDEGLYGLGVTSVEDGEVNTFTATDIPTSTNAIHQYTIDWAALSQGEKGVTVKIDSDGDDVEHTIITNNSFQPLIAEFTFSPENPLIGKKVTLDASTSFDLGGGVIKKYRWELYNAANQDPFYVIEGHDKEIISYSFTSEGIYRVRLTVTDDEGEYSYTESSTKVGPAKSDEDVLLGVPFFSQRDPEWKDQKLGKSTLTIGGSGCALTSVAMVSNYFGWNIDPPRLDAALTEIDGISPNGNLDWTKVKEASGGYVDWKHKMMDADWSDIDQELKELNKGNPGNPCIINAHFTDAKGKDKLHFVVIRGKDGSGYHFWDPADLPPGEDRIWPKGALKRTYTWGNKAKAIDKRIYLYHKGALPSEKNPISVIDEPPYFYKWSNSGHLDYWRKQICEGHTYYSTYGGGMYYGRNKPNSDHNKPDCWMEFTPYLQSAGKYWIYVGFCADSSRSTEVKYTVYPNGIGGSSKTVSVNQYSDKESWKEIKLGDTWDLSGSGKTHIVVTDATGEQYAKKKTLCVGTIRFTKATDTVNILTPTQTAYRNVGAHDKPIKTSIEVEIKTYNSAFAPGLTNKDDYTVKIGDKTADVCTVIEKSDRYVLEIMPPEQAGDGKYDLHIELGSLSDVENGAINYGTKGLDVTLIIDSSGSMRSNDPEGYRKKAAKYFVDLANTGDKICVAEFGYSSCNSSLLLPLLEITDESSKDTVKTAIDQVVSSGATPIGGGLEKGYDELSSPRAVAGHNKAGILLTDGNDTCDTESAARTYAQKFGDNGWVLYTIGLTGDADEDLLQKLAALGNGEYYKAPTNEQLMEIYNAISGRVAGEQTMRTAKGTAQQGSTSVENALIDSSVTKVKFTISWAGSNLNLTLKKPDGGIIDPDVAEADPNVIYTSASSYEFYTVQSPMPGEWELRIFGADVPAGGEEYTASIMGTANLTMNMYFDRDHYSVGEPIKVSVSLTDALQPITEASVIADIRLSPTASSSLKNLAGKDTLQNSLSIAQDQITLFDDGMHGDGMANDGVYANFYTNTNIEGTYKFTAKATGTRSPEEFERVIEQSIYVSGAPTPDLSVTPTPRLTPTPAPTPTLTPTPRPTLRPTATLFI